MPTIKEKLFFNYDGVWSNEFGLLHVVLDNGMYDEGLTASRSIIETKVKGKDKPHFGGFENSPLEFEMSVAFENGFDDTKLEEVTDWLIQDYYKPLYFEGKENRIFYCMSVDEPRIIHTGAGDGYITFSMRCNSPYTYSPVIVTEQLDLSQAGSGTIDIFNEGHGFLYPEISIEKVGDGNIVIRNINNGGEEFFLNDLDNGEDIYINTEREIIETDLSTFGIYRYDNASGEFTRLSRGQNRLEIGGACKIQFRYQIKYKV